MSENTNFCIHKTKLEGVFTITPFYMEDNRGSFLKSFEKDVFKSFGLDASVQEDFESFSVKDTVRGLHFQTINPQIKIVRVIRGHVTDVIVDIRKDSPNFGKFEMFDLSEKNHISVWVPAGFAHGFHVLSDEGALMSYKCVGKYEKGADSGILWNDKDLNIPWGKFTPVISERDSKQQTFNEFIKTYGGL